MITFDKIVFGLHIGLGYFKDIDHLEDGGKAVLKHYILPFIVIKRYEIYPPKE